MYPSTGLQTALNKMREMSVQSNSIYHQYVPVVTDSTSIGEFGQPILDSQNVNVLNDFVGLLKKVVMTAVYNKTFNNPLAQLEGDRMPLGQFIEDAYVNPAKARGFNVNDFAGLLQKYEAQIATQYLSVNSDMQYCVTITREKIRNAFTSWSNLESFVSGMINSLYNGAYITRYNQTKGLVLAAYTAGAIKSEQVDAVTSEATGKALIKKMRADYNKMQIPSTAFNAWNDVKEDGFALKTWSDPQDIIVMISADVEANISVDVLAAAFNMDKADFLGRVIVVDDFSQYDDDGELAVDGSAIQAVIMDKSWFKIKTQDFAADEFYNANNRTWQFYLNDVRMVNYSLFANAKVYSTEEAPVPPTPLEAIEFSTSSVETSTGSAFDATIVTTPVDAEIDDNTITFSSNNAGITINKVPGYPRLGVVNVAGDVEAGSYTVTATAGNLTATMTVTVVSGDIPAESISFNDTDYYSVANNGFSLWFSYSPDSAVVDITCSSTNAGITFNRASADGTSQSVSVGESVEAGDYTITATDSISGRTATATLHITALATAASFDGSTLSVEQDNGEQIALVATPSGALLTGAVCEFSPASDKLGYIPIQEGNYVTSVLFTAAADAEIGDYTVTMTPKNFLGQDITGDTLTLSVTAPQNNG